MSIIDIIVDLPKIVHNECTFNKSYLQHNLRALKELRDYGFLDVLEPQLGDTFRSDKLSTIVNKVLSFSPTTTTSDMEGLPYDSWSLDENKIHQLYAYETDLVYSAHLVVTSEDFATQKAITRKSTKEAQSNLMYRFGEGSESGMFQEGAQMRMENMRCWFDAKCKGQDNDLTQIKVGFERNYQQWKLIDTLWTACEKLDEEREFLAQFPTTLGWVKNFLIMYDEGATVIKDFLESKGESAANCVYCIVNGSSTSDRDYRWRLALVNGDKVGIVPLGVMVWWDLKDGEESLAEVNTAESTQHASKIFSIEFDQQDWKPNLDFLKKNNPDMQQKESRWRDDEKIGPLITLLEYIGIDIAPFEKGQTPKEPPSECLYQ